MKTIQQHEGRKYLRRVWSACEPGQYVEVDVYAVLVAFGVTCPARQHAVKKLLCTGGRGKGDELADLEGALAAVSRAVDLANQQASEAAAQATAGLDRKPVARK